MNNWKNVKLGDLVNFRRGYDLPHSEMRGNNFKVVASNGVIGYHSNYTTKAPVITIGRSGNIGTPFYYDEDCWAHNTTLYVDDFKNSYPKFIFYLLKTLNLKKIGGGSAVPTLNRNHIHPLEIYTTIDYNEQKAIAGVLSAFDDKIELNNRIIKNLEEQAQTLYKHWFVDFEFPNENGQPYKSSGGTFKDSELGKIPINWEVKKIKDVYNITIGRTPPRKNKELFSFNRNDINWISISDMSNNNFYIMNSKEYLNLNTIGNFNIPLVNENTVILSFKLTIGRVAITTKKCVTNEAIAHFNTNNKFLLEYTFLVLKNFDFSKLGNTSSIATAINSSIIKDMKILLPLNNQILKFHEKMNEFFEEIKKLQQENEKLAEMRDYLLPKLMSGKIKVKLEN